MGTSWIRWVVVLTLAMPMAAPACLWDRDTLKTEMTEMPGLTEIISGRFEQNPPAFYEMRLSRVVHEIEGGARDLELYDDAGVASDRLHRGDEAISWMAKKKSLIDTLDPKSETFTTHLYRYHANLGTFIVHKWLRAGAEADRIDELNEARDHIARAIEINPDAHFGREKYQLLAMDWLIALKGGAWISGRTVSREFDSDFPSPCCRFKWAIAFAAKRR